MISFSSTVAFINHYEIYFVVFIMTILVTIDNWLLYIAFFS